MILSQGASQVCHKRTLMVAVPRCGCPKDLVPAELLGRWTDAVQRVQASFHSGHPPRSVGLAPSLGRTPCADSALIVEG